MMNPCYIAFDPFLPSERKIISSDASEIHEWVCGMNLLPKHLVSDHMLQQGDDAFYLERYGA